MLNKVTKKPIPLELTKKTEREWYGGDQDLSINLDDLTTSNELLRQEEGEGGQCHQGLLIY